MTVFETMTFLTFLSGVFSAGFALGRFVEKHENDRHK